MVGYIASLRQSPIRTPQVDTSWLGGLTDALGGAIDEFSQRKSFNGLADRIGGAPAATQQPQGGFLSGLLGNQQPKIGTAPVGRVERQSIGSGLASDPVQSVLDAGSSTGPKSASQAAGVSNAAAQSNPMQLASSLLGKGEVPDRGVIQEYLKNGGVNLDPATTAWCAAYVNSTLAQSGYEGTGSNMARSFLNYGEAVDAPQSGDLAVFSRGNPNGPYGHVGFFDRMNEDGTIRVLGGNQGNQVSYANYPADRLLGYRRPVAGGNGATDAVNAMADGSLQTASNDPASTANALPFNQVADASGGMIAQGVTPIQRGGVDPATIQFMLRDPNLREAGLKLWAANVDGQRPTEPWQFVNLPDGTLARANQQTGAVERLGNFAKPNQGYSVLSQQERQSLGIPETDTRVYQRGADGKIDAVGGAGQTINVGNEVEARRQAAAQAGLSENDPAYQGFILTGKLPRESEQSLTATDKKAILEADEMVMNTQNVFPLIDRALELNDQAYSGPTAGIRGTVAGAIGLEGGEATQELDNVVIGSALTQLKAIFGSAPTEGERSILLDMSGASSKPAPVRKTIFERAKQAAQRRLDFYSQRAKEMRGGSYYKPGTAEATPAAPSPAPAAGSGQAIRRYNPATGMIE